MRRGTAGARFVGMMAISTFAMAADSSGASISVPGYSFEQPATTDYMSYTYIDMGGHSSTFGWVPLGNGDYAGVQNAGFTGLSGATGSQLAYVNQQAIAFGSASDLGTYTANTTYTLTVDVGSRSVFPSSGAALGLFRADLSTQVASTGWFDPVDDNTLHQYQLVYNCLPGDPNIGQGIRIVLSNQTGSNQTSFDNVRLDASAIPEPASLSLFGAGTLGVLLTRRRRF